MDQGELDHALDELDARLAELHVQYAGFFAGSTAEEPLSFRQDVERALAALMSRCAADGGSRAKIQGVLRTYDEYQQTWERLARRTMSGQQRLRAGPPGSSSNPPPSSDRDALPLVTRASVRPPKRASVTPPLGTPLVPPVATPPPAAERSESAPPAAKENPRPQAARDTSRTTPDLEALFTSGSNKPPPPRRAPLASDSAKTTTDLRSPVERLGVATPEPRRALPVKLATSLQGSVRLPQENELTPVYSARERFLVLSAVSDFGRSDAAEEALEVPRAPAVASEPSAEKPRSDPPVSQTLVSGSGERTLGRARISLESVKEIHARLRAMMPATWRPVSLERLVDALRETEEKLWAQHGDRRVTFDVIMKDGKAVVKPIVH